MTAVISHTICWQGRELADQFAQLFRRFHYGVGRRTNRSTGQREHAEDRRRSSPTDMLQPLIGNESSSTLSKEYPDVPLLWYLGIGVINMLLAMGVVE